MIRTRPRRLVHATQIVATWRYFRSCTPTSGRSQRLVIAEKLHAIALLGTTNSRLKDYFDLSVLLEREALDIDLLAQAIKATFERRGMAVPDALPVGLTDEFAHDASRQTLWLAFLKKNEFPPESLSAVVGRLSEAVAPALNAAAC